MSRKLWVWVAAIFSLVNLLLIGGYFAVRKIPTSQAQLDSVQPILTLSITQPYHRQQIASGQPISVFVTLDGTDSVVNIQAWVDGSPLALVMSSPMDAMPITAMFQWIPSGNGWHILTASTANSQGQQLVSAPVWVEVITPPVVPGVSSEGTLPPTILDVPTDSGDFDALIDARIEEIIAQAEVGQPASPSIPILPVPPTITIPEPPSGTNALPSKNTPVWQKVRLWFSLATGNKEAFPDAPIVTGKVENCIINIAINDTSNTELGFHVYRSEPGSAAWTLVADLAAHANTGWLGFADPNRPNGKYTYFVSAYNSAGENKSNLAVIDVNNSACDAFAPIRLSLQNAILTPTIPVQRLYCYLSINNTDWIRIPTEPQLFISGTDGKFDLSPHLKSIAPSSASASAAVDCWGWEGSTLHPLGRAEGGISSGIVSITASRFSISGNAIYAPATPGKYIYKPINFAPPYNLHYADSLAGCKAYTGKDAYLEWACANLIDQWGKPLSGHSILVWHWYIYDNCNASENYCGYNVPKSDVVGYRVYRQTGNNEPILIRSVDRNDILMAVLTPGETTSASTNTRYFVRAVSTDGWESGDSNSIQAVPAPFHMSIPALISQELGVRVYKPGGKIVGVVIGGDFIEQGENLALVGYLRHHSSHLPRVTSIYFQDLLYFDLNQVPGKITSATLMWDGDINTYGPGNDLLDVRCNNRVTDYMGTQVGYSPVMMLSMWADVTNLVILWIQNPQSPVVTIEDADANFSPYGFWLLSGDTSLSSTEYNYDQCTVGVKNVRLEVEYYK